jgi:hypothetical protein
VFGQAGDAHVHVLDDDECASRDIGSVEVLVGAFRVEWIFEECVDVAAFFAEQGQDRADARLGIVEMIKL